MQHTDRCRKKLHGNVGGLRTLPPIRQCMPRNLKSFFMKVLAIQSQAMS